MENGINEGESKGEGEVGYKEEGGFGRGSGCEKGLV